MSEKSETLKKLEEVFKKVHHKYLDFHFERFKNTQNFIDRIFLKDKK